MNNKDRFIIYENDNEFIYDKKNNHIQIKFNRVAFIFFIFFMISVIYSIHLAHLGSRNSSDINKIQTLNYNKLKRLDIIDRNGNFLAKTVNSPRFMSSLMKNIRELIKRGKFTAFAREFLK